MEVGRGGGGLFINLALSYLVNNRHLEYIDVQSAIRRPSIVSVVSVAVLVPDQTPEAF